MKFKKLSILLPFILFALFIFTNSANAKINANNTYCDGEVMKIHNDVDFCTTDDCCITCFNNIFLKNHNANFLKYIAFSITINQKIITSYHSPVLEIIIPPPIV